MSRVAVGGVWYMCSLSGEYASSQPGV